MQIREGLAVEAAAERVDRLSDDAVVLVLVARAVAGGAQAVDLRRRHAEEDEVVVADRLEDLDVRAVECAERDRAVDHELHV